MFLFFDIEDYLPADTAENVDPFPFRQEHLPLLIVAGQVQIPQLLLELEDYLKNKPSKQQRYNKTAAVLACKFAKELSAKGMYLEAIKYYEIALRYDEIDEISTGDYGQALFNSGDPLRAENVLSKFVKILPRLEYINYIVTYAELLKTKSCEKAMEAMQSYSQLKPDHENFWILYAELESLCSKKAITYTNNEPLKIQLDEISATTMNFPKLAIISGVESGRTVPLSGNVKIGRDDDNVIKLNDRKVSRHHASLEQTTNGWEIKDLNSSNGIYINGVRIDKQANLNNGDLLLIGETQMVFTLDSGNPKSIARISICPKCNNLVVAGALFCGTCGMKLE